MKAWEDIAPETPEFPVRGKTYKVPELGYRAMLTVQRIQAGLPTELDTADAVESWRLVMGSAWDEMVADDVPAEAVARAGLATLAFFQHGPEMCEQIWEQGVDPKAILAALAAQAESPAPKKPSSTAAASGTRSRASSSGTSSRPASPRKAKAKASRSRT